MTLRVDPESLVTSGLVVTDRGESMAAKHAAADNRVEAAQGGWQGLSAAAMVARSQSWAATTTALLTRLSDHAQAFHTSGQSFKEMETQNSQALNVPGQVADVIVGETAH
ncbi:WXG100 family type VII secretion target [Mycolicibacterium komossense]|uniref:WXG100 family type VII secretion target n=1 Tax=Mycolicibacterium komossense TaxID=1779 RepID=A0ABT3C4Y4_9MYCO|nr:WXG100 family type VII secretion target [Mycolicibacterium komossense]MCV7224531.1 WXG100 family type VII secretion target [Mycolicibacterium komossense]